MSKWVMTELGSSSQAFDVEEVNKIVLNNGADGEVAKFVAEELADAI